MSKVKVNYKSDLPPITISFKVNGKDVEVPTFDFAVRFFVEGYPGSSYVCSYIDGRYYHCSVNDSRSQLTCYIDNHPFGCGRLCCEYENLTPNDNYTDGERKVVTPGKLDVYLVEGVGDDDVEVLQATFNYEINEIASIEQTTISTASGGTNVITITETNGNTSEVYVKNGTDGVGLSSIVAHDPVDGSVDIALSDGSIVTLNLNHTHPQFESIDIYKSCSNLLEALENTSQSSPVTLSGDALSEWNSLEGKYKTVTLFYYNTALLLVDPGNYDDTGVMRFTSVPSESSLTTIKLDFHKSGNNYWLESETKGFQEELVSGTNIKTINSTSLLGSGNISVADNVSVVEVSGTTPSQTLLPNTFYKFTDAVTALTITLGTPISGIVNIYAFSFTAGADAPNIILPNGVEYADEPTIANGDYVEFSIMDNKAEAKVWQAQ